MARATKSTVGKNLSPKMIRKRSGSTVPFDESRIARALSKAMRATGEKDVEKNAGTVASAVLKDLNFVFKTNKLYVPTVEEVQDLVERQLILHKYVKTAKAYILYREERAKLRVSRGDVPAEVKALATESKKHFRNQLSEFIYYSTYSKWVPEKNRRETWLETISRYVDFMRENLGTKLSDAEYKEIEEYMLQMKSLGSMRLLFGAGKAARKNNIVAYNCSFIAPTKWQDLAEIMYISMSGTGCGYSVERQFVEQFPVILRQSGETLETHVIGDSKEGWCDALVLGLSTWSQGKDIEFDYSAIRPAGARLATMGGRASGPGPLRALLEYGKGKLLARQGRRLTTLDLHDLICKIGEVVVAGGVRRSALISLSDLDDVEMRDAKNGQFFITNPERSMANNSAVYNEKPTMRQFLDEWVNLAKAGTGERGIFNRGSLKEQVPVRRWEMLKKKPYETGTNPCGEIILQSKQFCNLSEVVARAEDTEETLMEKVRIATILGTYQASLTNFPYLSKEWKENCEKEALLGVSITGQWDCRALRNPNTFRKLKEVAIETNRKYAARFGINASTSITTAKPSGNGSQLFDSSSGTHPRHSKYYIRRVRIQRHDPLFQMLQEEGIPYHPEVGQDAESATTFVLEFPVMAPAGSVFKDDLSALEQLRYWQMIKENYTEHNPSTTISVGEDEWLAVGSWVMEHWDIVGGLSFLPRSEHIYRLAPYETITESRYRELMKDFPALDFSKLVLYEQEDQTKSAKELACVAGVCEIEIIPTEETVTSK
jgi:ribonucleoside-diphosphate reductase alpha chain